MSVRREVVIDHKRVAAFGHTRLRHRTSGEGCQVLETRGGGGFGHDDCRVLHGAGFAQSRHRTNYTRALLSDKNIDTKNIFVALINHRVDGERTLTQTVIPDH